RRLVVTGCLAERYRDELKKEIPEIDALLGTGEVEGIVDAIGSGLATRDSGLGSHTHESAKPLKLFRAGDFAGPGFRMDPDTRGLSAVASSPLPTYLYDSSTPRLLTTPRHYAYVKIAEGCDYTCAFCII